MVLGAQQLRDADSNEATALVSAAVVLLPALPVLLLHDRAVVRVSR